MATENTIADTENTAVDTATETRADTPTGPETPTPGIGTGSSHDGPSGAVWDALAANPGGTAAVIAAAAGMSKAAARRTLNALETAGHATRTPGTGKGRARTPDTWNPATSDEATDTSTSGETGTDNGAASPGTGAEPDALDAPAPATPADRPDEAESGEVADGEETMDAAATTAAREALTALSEAITAALAALEGADRDGARATGEAIYADSAKVRRLLRTAAAGARARTASGQAKSAPGELRSKVAAHLAAYPGSEFTPHEIGKAIGHSAGAVANALERLVGLGEAVVTCERPRRFTGTTDAEGGPNADTTEDPGAAASAPLAASA